MDTTTVKVSQATRDRIKAFGEPGHQSADAVIVEALNELERQRFWDAFDAAAAADPGDLAGESEVYASTLKDGLSE